MAVPTLWARSRSASLADSQRARTDTAAFFGTWNRAVRRRRPFRFLDGSSLIVVLLRHAELLRLECLLRALRTLDHQATPLAVHGDRLPADLAHQIHAPAWLLPQGETQLVLGKTRLERLAQSRRLNRSGLSMCPRGCPCPRRG